MFHPNFGFFGFGDTSGNASAQGNGDTATQGNASTTNNRGTPGSGRPHATSSAGGEPTTEAGGGPTSAPGGDGMLSSGMPGGGGMPFASPADFFSAFAAQAAGAHPSTSSTGGGPTGPRTGGNYMRGPRVVTSANGGQQYNATHYGSHYANGSAVGGTSADDKIPPASKRAILNLPSVVITKRDLAVDENAFCIICFEDQKLSSTATKLPCGHLFCKSCISNWLAKQCTCPVCRYELETTDAAFEKKRKATQRKPKYKEADLRRMAVRELKQICASIEVDAKGFAEKREFVDAILVSPNVEIIQPGDPGDVDGTPGPGGGENKPGGGGGQVKVDGGANPDGSGGTSAKNLDTYYEDDLAGMNIEQLRNTFKLFGLVVPNTREDVGKDELIGLLLNSGKIAASRS
ncbi:unnamed protein product [Amoebophrya sp. A25]|nr:unnamed protein product [Amoebophrya sp. A25]|eukprot:GSA25T00013919001.1